jgi:excisionase family DNA binding protein
MSRSTFYRAVRAGELPAFKIRGEWRVDRRDLEALIEERKGQSNGRGAFVSEAVTRIAPFGKEKKL